MKELLLILFITHIKAAEWYNDEIYDKLKNTAKYDLYSPSTHPFKDWLKIHVDPYISQTNFKSSKFSENFFQTSSSKEVKVDSYDSMNKYSNCFTNIKDQAKCRANWAFSISSVVSTAYCFHSKGKRLIDLSAQRLISCGYGSGCQDSTEILNEKLKYFLEFEGITDEKCDPFINQEGNYLFSCRHSKCYDKAHHYRTYKSNIAIVDLKKGELKENLRHIKESIYENGSIVGIFDYFDDFIYFKHGIYESVPNSKKLGSIFLKIYGWGTNKETRQRYWLVENSWSKNWGQNGYAQISVNQNIEYVIVVKPKLLK